MIDEHVMVVPTKIFHEIGYFQGFSGDVATYFQSLILSDEMSYQPRSEMETDSSFKQLIPYVLFRFRDPEGNEHLFQYTRGSGQGEKRLHSKKSIGVGGHISSEDSNCNDPYLAGMRRELEEEISFSADDFDQNVAGTMIGILNDDSNDVGKVHLGVVHVIDVSQPTILAKEKDLLDAGFWHQKQLVESIDQFETWSQIVIRHLYCPMEVS